MDYLIGLWNNLIDRLKKIGIKKIVIIILTVVVVFITISVITRAIQDKVMENKVKNKTYTSMADFESVQEVLIYKGCKYIEENNSTNSEYSKDIYLEFGKNLYNDGVSSQGYYNDLVCYVAYVLKYSNFRMIDNSKNIIIEVICDKDNKIVTNMIINGDKDYFGHMNSKNEANNKKTITETNINIQSNEIKELIKKEWKADSLKISNRDSTFGKYEIYINSGIEIRNIGTKVYNIVFTNNYKSEIVNGIKVGDSFDSIKSKLGEPAFSESYVIGYKSKDIYIFFTTKEVSVYRIEDEVNDELEELLREYDEKDIKQFINKLTDKWSDYDEYVFNEAYVYITYSLKGIRFQYNLSNRQGFIVYGNCPKEISSDLSENIYLENSKNAVFESEQKRISNNNNYLYLCNITETNDKKSELNNNMSTVFDYGKVEEDNMNKIIFVNKENYSDKYEIDDDVESYLWIDDYTFLYSIKKAGIYRLNLKTKKTDKITEGTDNYTFKTYSNGILNFENGKIKIK